MQHLCSARYYCIFTRAGDPRSTILNPKLAFLRFDFSFTKFRILKASRLKASRLQATALTLCSISRSFTTQGHSIRHHHATSNLVGSSQTTVLEPAPGLSVGVYPWHHTPLSWFAKPKKEKTFQYVTQVLKQDRTRYWYSTTLFPNHLPRFLSYTTKLKNFRCQARRFLRVLIGMASPSAVIS